MQKILIADVNTAAAMTVPTSNTGASHSENPVPFRETDFSNSWIESAQFWPSVQVEKAAADLRERCGSTSAVLCHSAGGWLARLYLQDFGTAGFDRLVSLGSPHRPPPEGAQGIVDQTRGILKFCEDNCPGAFHGKVSSGA
jgi:hypothetical protein